MMPKIESTQSSAWRNFCATDGKADEMITALHALITHFFNDVQLGLVEKFEDVVSRDFAVARYARLPRLENGVVTC
jgi:hypothetical protein